MQLFVTLIGDGLIYGITTHSMIDSIYINNTVIIYFSHRVFTKCTSFSLHLEGEAIWGIGCSGYCRVTWQVLSNCVGISAILCFDVAGR